MKIDIYAFSSKGVALSDRLIDSLDSSYRAAAYAPERYIKNSKHVKLREHDLYNSTEISFKNCNAILFISAIGIAVRAIAPCIKSKEHDPAVICIDERAQNVIPILSGHIGGANRLALKIAEIIGANPVITTATDINNRFAVDEWATLRGMHIMNLEKAREISAAILEGEKIGFYSDFDIKGELPDEFSINAERIGICVSLDENKKHFEITLNLIPKILSVGVGCRRGTDFVKIYNAINEVLTKNKLSCLGIKSLNSIDVKKDEDGIIKTAEKFNVSFNTYSKEDLNKIEGQFTESAFVKETVGVDTVSERAAVRGSNSKNLIVKKTIVNSVTVAVAIDEYEVNFSDLL
jgi:cobalt-precorrin 5A hydrolase